MKKALLIAILTLSTTILFSQFKYGFALVYDHELGKDYGGYYNKKNTLQKSYGIHGRALYEVGKRLDLVAAIDFMILKEGFGNTGNRLRLNLHINVVNNEKLCIHLIGGYNSSKLGNYDRATAPEFGLGIALNQFFLEARYTDNKSVNHGFISGNLGLYF